MAYASLNGYGVISGHVSIPLYGAWHATLTVDAGAEVTFGGSVTMQIGDSSWSAYVVRHGDAFGRASLLLVGGAGGLSKQLAGKSYRSVSTRVPITDIMADSGESLAATSDSSILSNVIPAWSRVAGRASQQLTSIATTGGGNWRVLQDGKVWIGNVAWTASTLNDYDIIDKMPDEQMLLIGAIDAYKLMPGQTLDGYKVSYLEHSIQQDAIRSRVWTQP